MDTSTGNMDQNDLTKVICIDKSVPAPDLNFYCSEEQLKWKKDYWKNRINGIKKVVAPMVDQRYTDVVLHSQRIYYNYKSILVN